MHLTRLSPTVFKDLNMVRNVNSWGTESVNFSTQCHDVPRVRNGRAPALLNVPTSESATHLFECSRRTSGTSKLERESSGSEIDLGG